MLYRVLRSVAGIALRWFYSRIDVEGLERVPRNRPLLLAVNHPNALVDALVVVWTFPRHVVLTAKATLFENPIAGGFFRAAGVVPLIRQQDMSVSGSSREGDARRNERAFDALHDALTANRAVLIFPEGITGDHVSLAPLRTGAARLALQACDGREAGKGVQGLLIVPIGLVFERKDAPRTRVLAEIGDPIDVDQWMAENGSDARALTAEIDQRLRAVTLNFETADDAARVTALASLFARVLRSASDVPPVWVPHAPLSQQVALARRLEGARIRLETASVGIRNRVDELLRRLAALRDTLAEHRLAFEDLEIALDVPAGAGFVRRELPVVLASAPIALWSWLNHLLPFNLARLAGRHSIESAADPAMRTIVSGVGLVLLFYVAQAALVLRLAGPLIAGLYLLSLPLAADANFYLRARLRRVIGRARSYLLFRRRPELREQLQRELDWIRVEARAIDGLLAREPDGSLTSSETTLPL